MNSFHGLNSFCFIVFGFEMMNAIMKTIEMRLSYELSVFEKQMSAIIGTTETGSQIWRMRRIFTGNFGLFHAHLLHPPPTHLRREA